MKSIIPAIVFILGIISICLFLIPVIEQVTEPVIFNNTMRTQTIDHLTHSNIFSENKIVTSRLIIYILIWSLFCFAMNYIFNNLKQIEKK